jgi:hypothetical protein
MQPYFYAGLFNEETGSFDVIVDRERPEQVSIGQTRVVGDDTFYDTWASFPLPGVPIAEDSFAPMDYTLDTTVEDDLSLRGHTALHLRAVHPGGRVITLELSRYLAVDECTDAEGKPLVFFQNEDVSRREMMRRGNDQVLVVLPAPAHAKEEFHIGIRYHGSVISNAGNGVYYVGARGTWYPHLNVAAPFASYDLTFHWPRKLRLVATGNSVETHEDQGQRSGRWRSAVPMAFAGFNLGDYHVQTLGENPKISLFASQEMEDALMVRIRTNAGAVMPPSDPSLRRGISDPDRTAAAQSGGLAQESRGIDSGFGSLFRESQRPVPVRSSGCLAGPQHVRTGLARPAVPSHDGVSEFGSATTRGSQCAGAAGTE